MNAKSKIIAVAPTTPPTTNPDFAKCFCLLFFIYKPFYTLMDFWTCPFMWYVLPLHDTAVLLFA